MSMCVVDTSVLIAIAFNEANASALLERIQRYDERFIGAHCLLEAGMVFAARKICNHRDPIDDLVHELNLISLDFSPEMEEHAWQAWLRYGKGRHPASLNYGDCMSYGVAAALNAPLLFVSNDFSQTAIEVA